MSFENDTFKKGCFAHEHTPETKEWHSLEYNVFLFVLDENIILNSSTNNLVQSSITYMYRSYTDHGKVAGLTDAHSAISIWHCYDQYDFDNWGNKTMRIK